MRVTPISRSVSDMSNSGFSLENTPADHWLFIKGDQVWFSEVSPRPHDTGLVTLISQDLSQFALHARAILGLPIPLIRQFGPSASAVILVEGQSTQTAFSNLGAALSEPDTALRLFGKPEVMASAVWAWPWRVTSRSKPPAPKPPALPRR